MKQLKLLLVAIICAGITINANAQIFGGLTGVVKEKAKEKLTQKVDDQSDYDRVKNTVNKPKPKPQPKPRQNNNSNNQQSTAGNSNTRPSNITTGAGNLVWNRYDFVPGDEIIFEDGPSVTEENGEFPSRWDLISGHVEIAEADGEPCIVFLDRSYIVPYLKNAAKDYLPDVFTLEFDFYKPEDGSRVFFHLQDTKNQGCCGQEFEVTPAAIEAPDQDFLSHPDRTNGYGNGGYWTHISLAFTKGKLKVYIDDARVVNLPHYKYNPTGFTFGAYEADGNHKYYLKNVRIAKGGVKYYDRVMQDGKIICKGIRFEKGKTDLRPESMGSINKIYKLMKKNPEFKFVVVGHTDSDGDDNTNLNLSQGRADIVKQRLIQMGISQDRLQSKGAGESEPIAGNDTPEGKANNRRVEFVKF